ncbi:KTSC domain-containing protein [Vibrio sp. ZSDZ34]|uniref:KTSC domain-containing protein n=1 Tax=Vibrio gelatinilyticus TaxID=2893468 RepID=A0A9X1WAC4_9VIBR|nr:KTSC domain-containing protein [Vibrio gelatinilyticus]MCJ2376923.1 KTSC domain-containing protein [Vibrio gelatinilyticus]
MKKILTAVIIALLSLNTAYASNCGPRVDEVQLFYVNGMFTTYQKFGANKAHLITYQKKYLANEFEMSPIVDGSYNNSEDLTKQVEQVAKQNYEEATPEQREVLKMLINGTFSFYTGLSDEEAKTLISGLFSELDAYLITGDEDYLTAERRLSSNLDQCKRVILVGHSQGNFYSNGLLESLYNKYRFDDGNQLSTYPMLSYMGIALPTSQVGGSIGSARPELVGHITNDTDFIMAAVREYIGAAPSNYDASFSFNDITGHGLIPSYLLPSGQANVIANHIKRIARNLVPPPIYEQQSVSSSAINSVGYSSISQLLDVQFADDSVYRYEGVPETVWDGFISASSKGKYFNISIKNSYSFTQIE